MVFWFFLGVNHNAILEIDLNDFHFQNYIILYFFLTKKLEVKNSDIICFYLKNLIKIYF